VFLASAEGRRPAADECSVFSVLVRLRNYGRAGGSLLVDPTPSQPCEQESVPCGLPRSGEWAIELRRYEGEAG